MVVDHPVGSKSADGVGPAGTSLDERETRDRSDCLIDVGNEESGVAVPDDLSHGPQRSRDDGRPGGQGLHDREAEGLRKADEMEQGPRPTEEGVSLLGAHRPHVGHVDAVDVRGHGVAVVRRCLDDAPPFASVAAAQEAVEAWRVEYNTLRPHQSLGMAAPAERFAPAPPPPACPWRPPGLITTEPPAPDAATAPEPLAA